MTENDPTIGAYETEVRTLSFAEFAFDIEAIPQIHQLLNIHREIGGSGPGRRYNLEVLNKAAIVLTSAFWEAFIEDLAAEALEHLAKNAKKADMLPTELKKSIARELSTSKHELSSWGLAGDGWRNILCSRAQRMKNGGDRTLSTPNSKNVENFFCAQAGIGNLSTCWHWPRASVVRNCERLDQFVGLRNEIAHRGGPTDVTVLKKDAQDGLKLVRQLAKLSLKYVNKKMEEATGVKLVPDPVKIQLPLSGR